MEFETDNFTIKRSEIHGVGAFLTNDVKRGDLVGPAHMLDDKGNAIGYFKSMGRFHNHSDNPNCEVNVDKTDKCTRIYCIKDSKAGDEILVDYAGYEEVNNININQWKTGEE